jgi:hypothetical protein
VQNPPRDYIHGEFDDMWTTWLIPDMIPLGKDMATEQLPAA